MLLWFCFLLAWDMPNFAVKSFVRVRPTGGSNGIVQLDGNVIKVPKYGQDDREFNLDGIIGPAASQEETFEATAAPVISSFLDGMNGTILAYGQTGAGKSFTMFGPSEGDYANRGLCSRAVSAVFRYLRHRGLTGQATVGGGALDGNAL